MAAPLELFELSMLGGTLERRYRRARPEVEAMPWGTMDLHGFALQDVISARRNWTSAAFQEHRTAVACALTLRALLEARAPLDLVALASRFPLDEVVHVELCSRMAMELGGGTELLHDPSLMILDAPREHPPLLRAAELVVRYFCVGEALSIPMLRGAWHAANHPLARAVLSRIVRDEAAHGTFGWTFLDWAGPDLDDAARSHLATVAHDALLQMARAWEQVAAAPQAGSGVNALGWMRSGPYLELARRSLRSHVLQPLHARGIMVDVTDAPVLSG